MTGRAHTQKQTQGENEAKSTKLPPQTEKRYSPWPCFNVSSRRSPVAWRATQWPCLPKRIISAERPACLLFSSAAALNQIPVRAPKIPQRPWHPSIRSVEAAVCEMWTLGDFRIRSGRAGTACPLLVISPLTPNIKKLSRRHLRRRPRPGSPMPSGESQRETASWPVLALPCSKQNRTHLQKPHYRHHHLLLHELIPFPCKPPSVFPTPCSCIAAQQLGLDPTTDGSDGGV